MSHDLRTAPELLAASHGQPLGGESHCFYCGAQCGPEHPAARYVKPTFNDWGIAAYPNSEVVCNGCVIALDEKRPMPGKDKPQKVRNYSWLLTPSEALPMTKADLARMRGLCIAPPEPPFALILATSGQRQLIFRAPVNHGIDTVAVQLETERMAFKPRQLADRLDLCIRLCAALGKPALPAAWSVGYALRLAEYWPQDFHPLIADWLHVSGEPLSRLAVFLCPNQEVSRREHPSSNSNT